MKIMLIDANFQASTPDIPLGIGYIAATLRTHGIPYILYDQSVRRYSIPYLARLIRDEKPDLIGLSCYSWTIVPSCEIAAIAKSINPSCTVVFGGPFVSGDPERNFRKCKDVDVIVRGDGEETFLELVTNFDRREFNRIQGLSYRLDGEIFHTPDRPLIMDLDLIPSPFLEGVFDLSKYSRVGHGFSRGCIQNCTFCAWGTQTGNGTFRKTSLELFLEELEYIHRHGPKTIIPHDGTFNYPRDFILSLCEEIHRRKLKFTWVDVDMRADWITREELEALRSIGVVQVGFGFESADPTTQKVIRKNLDVETLPRAVAIAKELGFSTHCGFIVGLPGEDRNNVLKSAEFAQRIAPQEVGVFPLELLPGTELYRNHIKYGIRKLEAPWKGPFGIECETHLMSWQEKRSLVESLSTQFNEFNQVVWNSIARGMRKRSLLIA